MVVVLKMVLMKTIAWKHDRGESLSCVAMIIIIYYYGIPGT